MLEARRALRARVPRRAHGQWAAPPDRLDPLEILSRSNANRLPELVPVRNGRMMASPFAYYRGSPAVMAADLSRTPSTACRSAATPIFTTSEPSPRPNATRSSI